MMKIRYILFVWIMILPAGVLMAQSSKEKAFRKAVRDVIVAFNTRDSMALLKYTDRATGVYLLYRNGVFDQYAKMDRVGFNGAEFPRLILAEERTLKEQPLKYGRLPVYNCEKEGWSKIGLYTDTSRVSHILSRICTFRNRYVPDNIPAAEIQKYYRLENKSRRVVLSGAFGEELVFYLSWLRGSWFLSMIDTVSSDCSA